MDLLHLKYFVTLADNEHLNKTAEKLIITPSTLSSSLSKLEESLGVKLFDRVGRNIKLNKFGKIYYRYCMEVFAALDNAKAEIADELLRDNSELNIGLTSPMIWLDAFYSFRTKFPNINCNLVPYDMYISAVERSSFDVIIASPDALKDPSLESAILFEDIPYLVVAKENPLAKKKSINLIEAKDDFFVKSLKNTAFRKFCDNLCRQAGFEPKSKVECDYVLRGRIVKNENMVGIVTKQGYLSGLYNSVVPIEIKSPIYKRPQAVFWHKNRHKTKAIETLIKFMTEFYKNFDEIKIDMEKVRKNLGV